MKYEAGLRKGVKNLQRPPCIDTSLVLGYFSLIIRLVNVLVSLRSW